MTLTSSDPDFESVARVQTLQAGHYWRSKKDIHEEGIEEGTSLLIQSIRWVDNKPHTVIMRPHPTKIGKEVTLEVPQGKGTFRRIWFKYEEHRFLVDDFLAAFEFEPDHQRIRNDEVRQVQARIVSLQADLIEAQSNPALLAAVVEEGLRKADQGSASEKLAPVPKAKIALEVSDASNPSTDMVTLAGGTISAAIGAGITATGIARLKAAAGREHQIATIKADWIQDKTAEIAEAISALTPFYEEQSAAVLAQTEDVRNYVEKLIEGIESLDLYVGKGVQVTTIRRGRHAGRDIPLTVMQRKLLMDEELAVWADVDEHFDFSSEDLFFETLRSQDALVRQIFPTERCILVMATTRRHIDYGDYWVNEARNKENAKVFLLVRDGENIHRIFSPVESHLGAARLFPSQDDQDDVFRGQDGSSIRFEDVAYTDKLTDHEKFSLHFKRFLLLICGLDHRLKLFGEFYDGPPSMHFVSLAFQDRYLQFLHDDDGKNMLPAENRLSLVDWIAEKNAYMRSGSRVLCNWRALLNPDTAPGVCKVDSKSYRGFYLRYKIEQDVSPAAAYRLAAALYVDCPGERYSTKRSEDESINFKVNLSKFKLFDWDGGEYAFLCLDAVSPEEVRWYIHNRGMRKDQIAYIRFFKRALQLIEAERSTEGPTRNQLADALTAGQVASPEEYPSIIDQAILAWRAANRGRPLPTSHDQEPEAWKALLDQMYMLAGEGKRRIAEVEAFLQQLGLQPLRLILSGSAKLVAYAAPPAVECDERLEPHAWVYRLTIERGKTKYLEKARRWAKLPKSLASETTLHEWPGAAEWAGRNTYFSTPEHKAKTFQQLDNWREMLEPFCSNPSKEQHAELLKQWIQVRLKIMDASNYVYSPIIAVPIGIVRRHGITLDYLCIYSKAPAGLLYNLAPDDHAREAVRTQFVRPYRNKAHAREILDAEIAKKPAWGLCEISVDRYKPLHGLFIHHALGTNLTVADGHTYHKPLLSDWLHHWKQNLKPSYHVWISDSVPQIDDQLGIDHQLNNALPPNYEPLNVRHITLSTNNGAPLPKYSEWVDIFGVENGAGDDDTPIWGHDVRHLLLSTDPDKKCSYSSSGGVQLSRQNAREYARLTLRAAKSSEWRVVLSTECPDAPLPPDGVERWIVVSE